MRPPGSSVPPDDLPNPSDRSAAGLRAQRWRVLALTWAKRLAIVAGALLISSASALWLVVHHYEAELPNVADLKVYQPPQVTRVLARDGTTVLAELYTQRRTVVTIQSLPPLVKLAVLAAEDAGFYEHEGLNYLGIARAMLVNARARSTRQGGSTITQQVVKNLLLATHERTLSRKIREALLARRLEHELSKDGILEAYLNNVYFGRGRYGIEEAARDDFGKSAKDLTIAQAALIAGRIANPRDFHARTNLTSALARRTYVLDQMRAKGFLTDAQWTAAKDEPATLAPIAEVSSDLAPEAVEMAKAILYRIEPEQARLGGFTITTSIDPKLQTAARKALRDALAGYDKRHGLALGLKSPPAVADKKGRSAPPRDAFVPFDGTPIFEHHRVLVGVVASVDDGAGAFDVRVGTVTGTLRLADCERYNQANLAPSAFAPIGARVRVSLLAPVPEAPNARVPLRLESGPEGALVAIDARTRQIVALIGGYEGRTGTLDRATQS
ncbi:MAG: transglycosylase domain-containing protein, partial [Myxococcota bacterium]|nr:transglycosylase domain-containing protein [Myxococcota bacterium]